MWNCWREAYWNSNAGKKITLFFLWITETNFLSFNLQIKKYDFFLIFPIAMSLTDSECKCERKSKNCKSKLFETSDFKIYLQLRRIVDFCNSTFYEKEDLESFDNLVAKFLFNMAEVTQRLTFKAHHISHYVDCIKKCGPLFFLATLR